VPPSVWRGDPSRIRPPYDKVIGATVDKIQVFAGAHPVESDERTAELLNRPAFRGDILLIAPAANVAASSELRLEANERLEAVYEVLSFNANSLRLKVALPEDRRGAWLLYCDAWHSDWQASVNGRAVPVARGFLAYKAVPLDAGPNEVEFRIRSPLRLWTFRLGAVNATLWVAGVIVLALREFVRR
jgi:hypothetical protein